MSATRLCIASIIFLTSLNSSAQIQPCIDVRAVRSNNGAGQGVYDFSNKWTPGTTLKVSFIGGTEWQRSKVKQYAPVWSQYANIKFSFITFGTSDVRISFNPEKGSYSFIGVDAKNRPAFEETMNLGWINTSKTESQLKSVILHEFGHALGLLHEHMNPLSNIKWNKPLVYAYYLQYEGWSKDMVDQQVFDRYSVSMTNKRYDPVSIMHYPIPKDFTLDGYSVKENSELSAEDKKLIAELYPANRSFPITNLTNVWSSLQDVHIDYNVKENGVLGMRIKQSFLIYNAQAKKCIMAVYFHDAETGKPIRDKNGINSSSDGNVAGYTYFTPNYQNTQFTDLSVFMPYDELELGRGNFRLKCYVAIFDPNLKQITTGGYQYFTFSQGINCKEVNLRTRFDDATQQIVITPIFTIENAKNVSCKAVAYFYTEQGVPLKDYNNLYHTTDGNVSAMSDFNPLYNITLYNDGPSGITISLPYSELHLLKGFHKLRYRVILFDDKSTQIASSLYYSFNYTQN